MIISIPKVFITTTSLFTLTNLFLIMILSVSAFLPFNFTRFKYVKEQQHIWI